MCIHDVWRLYAQVLLPEQVLCRGSESLSLVVLRAWLEKAVTAGSNPALNGNLSLSMFYSHLIVLGEF